MPIHPQFLVKAADGTPQPPAELVQKLKRYDERIGLFYTNAAWAITEAWRADDPRRLRIQAGEMDAKYAFDICGYLPVTCAIDEAPAYIERELKAYTLEQFKAIRASVNHWNDVVVDQALEETVLTGVEQDMTKSGPSLGKFNVPSGPGTGAVGTVSAPATDAGVASAMASRRPKKKAE